MSLGTDLLLIDGFEGHFPTASGRLNLGAALIRRCTTNPNSRAGATIYKGKCIDVRRLLLGRLDQNTAGQIEQDLQRICLADDRVEAAMAFVQLDPTARSLKAQLTITDAQGPFPLVIAMDEVTVEILNAAQL